MQFSYSQLASASFWAKISTCVLEWMVEQTLTHFYINWWRIATQQELSARFLVFTKNMATRSTRNYLSIFNYSKLVLLVQFSILFIPPWLKRSRANFSLRFNFRLCKMGGNWFNDHKNTKFVHRSRLGESLARRKRLSFWKM